MVFLEFSSRGLGGVGHALEIDFVNIVIVIGEERTTMALMIEGFITCG